MKVTDMRRFLKKVHPNSLKWAQKVDQMHDEQVVAIYMNPVIQESFSKKYTDADLLENKRVKNSKGYYLSAAFKAFQAEMEPNYTKCPHCGANLDIDEHCDCYDSHESQRL